MKIIQVCSSFSTKGGLERVIATLLNHWCIERDVALLILSHKIGMAYHLNEKIQIKKYGSFFLNDRFFLKRYLNYFFAFLKFIFDLENWGRGNVYIANGPWAAIILIFSKFILGRKRYKVVVCDHNNPNSFGRITNFFRNYLYHKADCFVVLNKEQIKDYSLFNRPVFLIRNPIEKPLLKKEAFNGLKVLAVGRLNQQKGFDRLINVWNLVVKNKKNARLLIVGEGEDLELLNQMIIDLNLLEVIKIVPFQNELSSYYLDSDLYVMTSRNEGLPMVLLEAQSFGLPIVAFDCNYGPREIVNNNIDGYLVEDGNIEVMAEKIISLLESDDRLTEFSLNSIKNSENFQIEKVNKDWIKLFEFIKDFL